MEFHNQTIVPTCHLMYIYYFNRNRFSQNDKIWFTFALRRSLFFKKHFNEPTNIGPGTLFTRWLDVLPRGSREIFTSSECSLRYDSSHTGALRKWPAFAGDIFIYICWISNFKITFQIIKFHINSSICHWVSNWVSALVQLMACGRLMRQAIIRTGDV